MKIASLRNAHGVTIGRYRCEYCGRIFDVMPEPQSGDWSGCLSPRCQSYDPGRDVGWMFEDA